MIDDILETLTKRISDATPAKSITATRAELNQFHDAMIGRGYTPQPPSSPRRDKFLGCELELLS